MCKGTASQPAFLVVNTIVILIILKSFIIKIWHGNLAELRKRYFMKLDTKYDDLADDESRGKKAGLEKTASEGKVPNVGTGPVTVPDGGVAGEEKQPKERTGQLTDMGGATGGTSGLPDASEGNDNTGTAG